MRARSASLIFAALAVGLAAACSSSSSGNSGGSSGQSAQALTVTAAVKTGAVTTVTNGVKANGTNVVTIQVDGATKAPIQVTTSRGTFAGGVGYATIAGVSGSVDLTTCDARTDSTCAGSVTVSAVDGNFALGRVTVDFVGFETICNDGKDNNGDGRIDCADPDCDLQACATSGGAAGTCQNLLCVPAVCVPTGPEICNNGIDDDCNGKIDCADSACDGQNCKAGSPTFVCQAGACTDVSSGYSLSVASARSRLPADGLATTVVTVTLANQGSPQPNTDVALQTTLGTFAGASGPVTSLTVRTGSDGTATATFTASATAGTATITAALASIPQVSLSIPIAMPALGSISVSSLQNPVMGVKYSGWNEQNRVSVLLLDTEQLPYPDGLAVRFEHRQLGGSQISQPWTADTATCLAAQGCIGYLAQTASPAGKPDSAGLAWVNLYSGTAAGLVGIQVTATAGGVTRSYDVQNVAIVGAKASGAHLSVDCTPKNVPALMDTDCTTSYYAGPGDPITCTAYLGDRFNNVLGVPVLATFRSEAGSAGPPVLTAAYDPTTGGDQTAKLGFVSDSIKVSGGPLPLDVAPLPGEASASYSDGCSLTGPTVHNPRDGLSTIIVMAQGEEGFVDLNGNGVWDPGEPFIDQGEPFVDANDNGVWDPGEYFVDVNQNGVYDGPNGKWDSSTVIWAETRVLYTGLPSALFSYSPASPFTVTSSSAGGTATTVDVPFTFADKNLNELAPIATYGFAPEGSWVTTSLISVPTSVDHLGLTFTQEYCDQPAPTPPTTCSNVCPTAPCYVRTSVGGFGCYPAGVGGLPACGSSGVGSVTGGSAAGSGYVDATATIDGVTWMLRLPGIAN